MRLGNRRKHPHDHRGRQEYKVSKTSSVHFCLLYHNEKGALQGPARKCSPAYNVPLSLLSSRSHHDRDFLAEPVRLSKARTPLFSPDTDYVRRSVPCGQPWKRSRRTHLGTEIAVLRSTPRQVSVHCPLRVPTRDHGGRDASPRNSGVLDPILQGVAHERHELVRSVGVRHHLFGGATTHCTVRAALPKDHGPHLCAHRRRRDRVGAAWRNRASAARADAQGQRQKRRERRSACTHDASFRHMALGMSIFLICMRSKRFSSISYYRSKFRKVNFREYSGFRKDLSRFSAICGYAVHACPRACLRSYRGNISD